MSIVYQRKWYNYDIRLTVRLLHNGIRSKKINIESGVPQGCLLPLLLFITVINCVVSTVLSTRDIMEIRTTVNANNV